MHICTNGGVAVEMDTFTRDAATWTRNPFPLRFFCLGKHARIKAMARKRNGLVPIGEVFGNLAGPVKAIREAAAPQAVHHYTVADQVDQLVSASEADPDLGFMARLMALCSLPRTNPGNRFQYKRVNGPYTLIMYSSGETKLPYGNFPRLLLAWVSTEAVRTQNRVLVLGPSLAKFMRELGVYSSGGGTYTLNSATRWIGSLTPASR